MASTTPTDPPPPTIVPITVVPNPTDIGIPSSLTMDLSSSSTTLQDDPSTTPLKESSKGVPKVGGSVGGFIGLVVALCIIILISCTAVFFLLRHREPSHQERRLRRQRKQQADVLSSTSPFNYTTATTTNVPPSWKTKLTGIFGSRGKAKNRGGGSGWVRTGSGDDWEGFSEDEEQGRRDGVQTQTADRGISMSQSPISPGTIGSVDPPPNARAYQQASSTSSVGIDLYAPGTAPPPPLHSLSERSSSPPLTEGMRSTSPDPLPVSPTQGPHLHDDRQFSTHSGLSMRTFEGGTKFIESL